MPQKIAKCLLLLAVLLMPFGMTPATGAREGTAATMSHCNERDDAHHSKGGIAECTMACAAALPAAIVHPAKLPEIAASPPTLSPVKLLKNACPDTRTPPPRQS